MLWVSFMSEGRAGFVCSLWAFPPPREQKQRAAPSPLTGLPNRQGQRTAAVDTLQRCFPEINRPSSKLLSSKWQKPDKKLSGCGILAALRDLAWWLGGSSSPGQREEAMPEILGKRVGKRNLCQGGGEGRCWVRRTARRVKGAVGLLRHLEGQAG